MSKSNTSTTTNISAESALMVGLMPLRAMEYTKLDRLDSVAVVN